MEPHRFVITNTLDLVTIMMNRLSNIVMHLLLVVLALNSIGAMAQNDTHHLSSVRKGVKISTDVGLIALPVATLAGVLIEKDWTGLKQGALSAATTAGATLILKYAVKEERPDRSNFHSFPSGHTSTTFATATFLQRRYGWKFGVPAYIVATYVGWGRVYAKKHHWWDVLAGAAIGAGSALIYTRPFAEKHELTFVPYAGPDGFSFSASVSF